MSLVSELPSLLASLISIIDHAYIYLISAFWYIATYYGLNPKFAFIQYEFANAKFNSLFTVFTGIYAQVIAIGLLVSAVVFLFQNSFFRSENARNYTVRVAIAAALVIFSFDLIRAILYLSYSIFNVIWQGSGINWYSLPSVLNTNYSFLTGQNLSASINGLVEFFLLSSLFVSVGTLFGLLMIREAIILVLVVALPFLSVLTLVPKIDSYAIRFWSLLIQLSVLPFFMIIPIYLSSLFPGNFPLQLALITGATLMPVLFVTSTRIFSLGSLFSLLDSMNFQRTFNRMPLPGMENLSPANSMNKEQRSQTNLFGNSGSVNWSNVYSKKFDYNRYGRR